MIREPNEGMIRQANGSFENFIERQKAERFSRRIGDANTFLENP